MEIYVLQGDAGSGKTTFILQKLTHVPPACRLAPTGRAAWIINGQTIHKALGIDCKPTLQAQYVTSLVIDEASMVGATLFGHIVAFVERSHKTIPIYLVGDWRQLPPVQDEPIWKHPKFWPNVKQVTIREMSYRCAHSEMLARLARGTLLPHDYAKLKSRVISTLPPASSDTICLYFKRISARVRTVEAAQYHGSGPLYTFKADDREKITEDEEDMPIPQCVQLRDGHRVVLKRTLDQKMGLVNGALGTVTRIWGDHTDGTGEHVEVLFKNDIKIMIYPTPFGARTQIPLVPAYAMTIHSAQGLTLESAVHVDLEGMQDPALAYVAFSRVRTPDMLTITHLPSHESLNTQNPDRALFIQRLCARTVLSSSQAYPTTYAQA